MRIGKSGGINGAAEFVVKEMRIYRETVGQPYEVRFVTAERMKTMGVDVRKLIDEGTLKVLGVS